MLVGFLQHFHWGCVPSKSTDFLMVIYLFYMEKSVWYDDIDIIIILFIYFFIFLKKKENKEDQKHSLPKNLFNSIWYNKNNLGKI